MGEREGAEAHDADNAALSAALAKWLIPSVAVLFGVVGYVVQFAQTDLLGVEVAERQNDAYFNSAADFFRDAAVRFLSLPQAMFDDRLLHRPLLVIYALVALTLAL